MPSAPNQRRTRPRLEALFLGALLCLVLTFTTLNLGEKPQTSPPPHSLVVGLSEKPSIRKNQGSNKRALGKVADDNVTSSGRARVAAPESVEKTNTKSQQNEEIILGAAPVANVASHVVVGATHDASATNGAASHDDAPKVNPEKPVEGTASVSDTAREATVGSRPAIASVKTAISTNADASSAALANARAAEPPQKDAVSGGSTKNNSTKIKQTGHVVNNTFHIQKEASLVDEGSRHAHEAVQASSVDAKLASNSSSVALNGSSHTSNEKNTTENRLGQDANKAKAGVPQSPGGNGAVAVKEIQSPNKTFSVRRGGAENVVTIPAPGSGGEHFPTYFRNKAPLNKLIARGNVLRVYSGCSIAAWSYSGWTDQDDERLDDCCHDKGPTALLMHQVTSETADQVQPYDTVYVPIVSLERFVANVLPKIQNDFVLLTGQKSLVQTFSRELFDEIIEHPRVIRWFLQNQAVYSHDPHHPKIGIFPYGLFKDPQGYLMEMAKNVTKQNFIYIGYLNKGTNKQVRKNIPRLRDKQPPQQYFAGIHNSTYVLSPDGDRPECHRHYESIGLGAMPITGLDPFLHRHLLGNVIYGQQRWKLAELEQELPRNPTVNRRLVFEEYWMEYIEGEMGRPLRWWDPTRNVRSSLEDIQQYFEKSL